MNTQRISWFWPVSFLAALGQLLLLVTDNSGGPGFARVFLAAWTVWLPGAWLGNLLTRSDTRLPALAAVQGSCALGIAFLFITLRGIGILSADTVPFALSVTATLVALGHLLGPSRRPARRAKAPARGPEPAAALSSAVVGGLGILLAVAHLILGAPLSVRVDGPDHLASIRLSGSPDQLYPSRAHHEELGTPATDGERGLFPALLHATSRLSHADPTVVWRYLPALFTPLLLGAFFLMGLALFDRSWIAGPAAVLQLLLFMLGWSHGNLLDAGFPDHVVMIPFWTALALFLDGQDHPHLPSVFAFALAGFAVWCIHFVFGVLLVAVILIVALRSLTSVERFQEGVPLLIALFVPWFLLSSIYLIFRRVWLDQWHAYSFPPSGVYVTGVGGWIVDPTAASVAWLAAGAVGLLFLPTLRRRASRTVGHSYLISVSVGVVVLAFTPWMTPWVGSHLGAGVHYIPWIAPVGFVLAAQAEWARRGLARGAGSTWLRLAVLGGTSLILILSVFAITAQSPLRPSVLNRMQPSMDAEWKRAAEAARDALHAGDVIVAHPEAATRLTALAPLHSFYWPDRPGQPQDAFERYLTATHLFRHRPADLAGDEPVSTPADSLDGFTRATWPELDDFLARYAARFLVLSRRGEPPGSAPSAFDGSVYKFLKRHRPDMEAIALTPSTDALRLVPHELGSADRPLLPEHDTPLVRTPARFDSSGPYPIRVVPDTAAAAAGSVLRVDTSWRRPADLSRGDLRGYRLRAELWRVDSKPRTLGSRARRGLRHVADWIRRRHRTWGQEFPLGQGMPMDLWSEDRDEILWIAIPPELVSGVYELRLGSLRGVSDANVLRPGLAFLPKEATFNQITIGKPGR